SFICVSPPSYTLLPYTTLFRSKQMENVVGNQEKEIVSINKQLDGLEETNRDVVPLMIEMSDALLKLVQADMPFRQKERVDRAKRSEEHTSELQSRFDLVCRLLL